MNQRGPEPPQRREFRREAVTTMMMRVLACAIVLFPSADGDAPPAHVKQYLQRCDEAKTALIKAKEAEIKGLARQGDKKKLDAAQAELKRLQEQPAPLARLPLPPKKGDAGFFGPAVAVDARRRKSVEVLEVVDEDDVIIRAWYLLTPPGGHNAGEEATFVDLWVHGIDARKLAAGSPAKLPQVFHVTGNRLFDTACGKRSLPLLEVHDLERYRKKSGAS